MASQGTTIVKPEELTEIVFDAGSFAKHTATILQVSSPQIEGAVRLLEEGNTIPFIARYRKEATRGLDERQLRAIEDALAKAKELASRKNTVLKTIAEQGSLTKGLRQQIEQLSEQQQEVLRLRLKDGLSYQQIADVTGLSASNVGYHLHQAVTTLRSKLRTNES